MTHFEVTELGVTIGDKQLVQDISFEIQTGQWLCIIGPNGAGKSTLIKSLAGLVTYSGSQTVEGNDLAELSVADRACWIAYVPQDPIAPRGMRVVDYILLGRTAHLGLLAPERPLDFEITNDVINQLGLSELAQRDLATLSGGERQRVAIARALAQASPIMLLDEPTSALDVGYQQDVLELIDRLRKENKIAVISTMHDLTIAGQFPDRILLMAQGKQLVQGTAREVLTAENIFAAYAARVRVTEDASGPIIIPMRGYDD
jgi:iron complex transport system ATP-binding protein